MIITAVRKLQFCAGHRVYQHEGKCANLHDHGYEVELHAVSAHEDGGLDTLGRVIDFSVLKDKVGTWIDVHFDHGMILFSDDGPAIKAVSNIANSKMMLLPYNPTAENIARY